MAIWATYRRYRTRVSAVTAFRRPSRHPSDEERCHGCQRRCCGAKHEHAIENRVADRQHRIYAIGTFHSTRPLPDVEELYSLLSHHTQNQYFFAICWPIPAY